MKLKKLLLIPLMILSMTSCDTTTPPNDNEIEVDLFRGQVVYKTTELLPWSYGSIKTYVYLMNNDDVVETDLPHWFHTQVGDSIWYERPSGATYYRYIELNAGI